MNDATHAARCVMATAHEPHEWAGGRWLCAGTTGNPAPDRPLLATDSHCGHCGPNDHNESQPTGTDPAWLTEAVEAGALALWTRELGKAFDADELAEAARGWEHLPPHVKQAWRRNARAAILAALPAIREGIRSDLTILEAKNAPAWGNDAGISQHQFLMGYVEAKTAAKELTRVFGSDVTP